MLGFSLLGLPQNWTLLGQNPRELLIEGTYRGATEPCCPAITLLPGRNTSRSFNPTNRWLLQTPLFSHTPS